MDPLPPAILLVEDDPDDVMLFKRALRKVRPDTDLAVARDGDEAVEILSKGEGRVSPSHVILDLKLPRRSGLEVVEWIRDRHGRGGMQVVILTSSQQAEDLEWARRAGVERYHVKPPNFTELVEMIRRILTDWHLLP